MLLRVAIVTAPGIGKIALKELNYKKISYTQAITLPLKTQETILLTIKKEYIKKLYTLRTVDDIFLVLYEGINVKNNKDLSHLIVNNLKEKILSVLIYLPQKRKKRTTNFWIFVKQDIDRSVYRRNISNIIGNYILNNFKKWRQREPADIELWSFYSNQKVTLGLRLTDITFRQRKYKVDERSGSLRPTLASALVLLSDPNPNDYFMDPMCGVGTIPIERSFWGPAKFIGGGDIDSHAIKMAKKNVESLNKPIILNCWDSTKPSMLKAHNGNVTKLVSNLPFGKKFCDKKNLKFLYSKAINCWSNLLATEGEMLLLTSQNKIIEAALREIGINFNKMLTFSVQGIYSTVYNIR